MREGASRIREYIVSITKKSSLQKCAGPVNEYTIYTYIILTLQYVTCYYNNR